MHESLSLNRLMKELQEIFETFPDLRTGQNTRYEVSDAGKGAFSVFFTQCASFLEHQEEMQRLKGRSNAQTLFGMKNIPSDSHTHARFTLGPGLAQLPGTDVSVGFRKVGSGRAVGGVSLACPKFVDCVGWDRIFFIAKDKLSELQPPSVGERKNQLLS
jgi:hypothetical protein